MTRRGLRSPVTAASLSFLFPGLGQYAAGARRRGVLIAIPALVVLTALVGFGIGTVLGGGPRGAASGSCSGPRSWSPSSAATSSSSRYHAFAILDAWLVARRAGMAPVTGPAGSRSSACSRSSLLATLGYGTVAALGVETEDTLAAVFQGDDRGHRHRRLGDPRRELRRPTRPAASTPPRRARHRRRRPTRRATRGRAAEPDPDAAADAQRRRPSPAGPATAA